MKLLNLGLLALLLGSGADIASAGTITGTIKGPDGAPFRAAFVRVQNVKSKMTMMVLSDSQGRYWTDNLDPGTYDVWATAVGYKGDPARRGNVTVDDKRQTIDFTMQTSLIQWSRTDQIPGWRAASGCSRKMGTRPAVFQLPCPRQDRSRRTPRSRGVQPP